MHEDFHNESEPGTWVCASCGALNSEIDADCQFCEGDVEEDQPDYSKPISDLGAADNRDIPKRDAAWDSEAHLRNMEGWGDYEGPITWP